MPDRLSRYREMRDFTATPEPGGAVTDAAAPAAGGGRFVVQEHSATALHWDLRLERDGALASWAVPKGIPPDPRQDHLAVQTEDHPIEYLTFHGEIPEGSYGAGSMTVWDTGTYEWEKFDDREVMFTLHGERVQGRYVLFRTGGRNWMIHRMDPPADPTREPMPSGLRPMLATTGALPDDEDGWAFEIRWTGERAILEVEGGRVEGWLADGSTEPGDRYPELRTLGRSFSTLSAVVDAVIVSLGPDGRPSAEAIERRRRARSNSVAQRLARDAPVVVMAVDLLWLEGHAAMPLPYTERRRLLAEVPVPHEAWQVPAHHAADGAALFQAATAQQLAGVVAKRLDSPYEPGIRSDAWREILVARD